jgi:DNA (cytosine-5)-methyltransferase 1
VRVLDLFSGIGGMSLGLERAGSFETVAFCEINPFCRRVLAKHWPSVECHEDINTLPLAHGMADMVTAGFPCQDLSFAGKGAGLAGARSGLWWKVRRTLRVVRPPVALLENVAALLHRGMGTVFGSLAAIGYDTEWHCIPATAVGADHFRDRTWVVAYTDSGDCDGWYSALQVGWGGVAAEIESQNLRCRAEWPAEPGVCRIAYGIPDRVEQCNGYGNAVVPQIPELIGRAIMACLDKIQN